MVSWKCHKEVCLLVRLSFSAVLQTSSPAACPLAFLSGDAIPHQWSDYHWDKSYNFSFIVSLAGQTRFYLCVITGAHIVQQTWRKQGKVEEDLILASSMFAACTPHVHCTIWAPVVERVCPFHCYTKLTKCPIN